MNTTELLAHIDAAIEHLVAIRAVGNEYPQDNYNPVSATTNKYIALVIQNLRCGRGDIAHGIVRDHMGYPVEEGIDRLTVAAARRDDVSELIG